MEAYLLIFLTVLVGHVKLSTICYDDGYSTTKYCTYDCCGSSGYQYCCNDYSPIYTGSTIYSIGTIVGIVIGSLAGLGVLIAVIACCCCHQCRSQTSGQVIQPHMNPGISMVVTPTVQTNGMQMQMNQMPPGIYANAMVTPQMVGGYVHHMPDNPSINKLYATPPPAYDHSERK